LIPDAKIAEIRERADIAEVVGDYVSLKRAGANMKGVCPFHADGDPSFNVNPARQFFHCFGCGASGDVFGFLQRIEGLDFLESARRLAARYSVELPERQMSPEARTKEQQAREATRRRRYILEEAAAFFESQLKVPAGEPAREMLKSRGIDGETAKKYRLGYAPDSWSSLIDFLETKRITARELEDVGLVLPRKSGQGFYDRFRHRMMFTITDASGQPIAFSGRTFSDDNAESGAKYVNSPETREYTKGKVLYGLHQARVPISKLSEVVIVEGNFDVVSLARVGIEHVVAPLGTALTMEQASLIRNRVERVTVMFDGDAAGRKAAARAFMILAGAGLAAYTAPLPDGEDPDSLVRSGGADAVNKLLDQRCGLLDQIIDDLAAKCDGSMQDIARRIEKIGPLVATLKTQIESDLYRQKIADAFSIEPRSVFRLLRGGGPGALQSADNFEKSNLPGRVAERELVGLLLDMPHLWEKACASGAVALVETHSLKKLLVEFGEKQERKEASIAEMIAKTAGEQVGPWLAERAMNTIYLDVEKSEKALEEIRKKLADEPLKEQLKELNNQIRLADSQGNEMRVLELSREKATLRRVQ
jgi:DNA primase